MENVPQVLRGRRRLDKQHFSTRIQRHIVKHGHSGFDTALQREAARFVHLDLLQQFEEERVVGSEPGQRLTDALASNRHGKVRDWVGIEHFVDEEAQALQSQGDA